MSSSGDGGERGREREGGGERRGRSRSAVGDKERPTRSRSLAGGEKDKEKSGRSRSRSNTGLAPSSTTDGGEKKPRSRSTAAFGRSQTTTDVGERGRGREGRSRSIADKSGSSTGDGGEKRPDGGERRARSRSAAGGDRDKEKGGEERRARSRSAAGGDRDKEKGGEESRARSRSVAGGDRDKEKGGDREKEETTGGRSRSRSAVGLPRASTTDGSTRIPRSRSRTDFNRSVNKRGQVQLSMADLKALQAKASKAKDKPAEARAKAFQPQNVLPERQPLSSSFSVNASATVPPAPRENFKGIFKDASASWPTIVLRGALLLSLGLAFVVLPETTISVIGIVFGVMLFIEACASAVQLGAIEQSSAHSPMRSTLIAFFCCTMFVNLILGILAICFPNETAEILLMIVAIWFVVVGALELLLVWLLKCSGDLHIKSAVTWGMILAGLIFMAFGIVLLTDLQKGVETFTRLIGAVIMLFAMQVIGFGLFVRTLGAKDDTHDIWIQRPGASKDDDDKTESTALTAKASAFV